MPSLYMPSFRLDVYSSSFQFTLDRAYDEFFSHKWIFHCISFMSETRQHLRGDSCKTGAESIPCQNFLSTLRRDLNSNLFSRGHTNGLVSGLHQRNVSGHCSIHHFYNITLIRLSITISYDLCTAIKSRIQHHQHGPHQQEYCFVLTHLSMMRKSHFLSY